MSDSLLTICQNVADEVGFSRPATIVNNTDATAKQLYRLANRTGHALKRVGWQVLRADHTFTLVTGTQTYALPADFGFIVPNTTWDRSKDREVLNPLSAQQWAFSKGWGLVTGINRRARIKGNLLEFDQTITSADNGNTIAFEYVSDYWAESSGGTDQAEFSADTDVSKLDDELMTLGVIWRFKKAKGLDYADDFAEYSGLLKRLKATDGGATSLSLNAARMSLDPNIPEGNFNV